MERICLFPGCRTMLSERVPNHIRLCGEHQFETRKLADRLKIWNLPEDDYIFLVCHEKGSTAKGFANYLQVDEMTILARIRKGQIKAQRWPGCRNFHKTWRISLNETARIIAWVRNWISIRQAAAIANVATATLLGYARNGHFGLVAKTFQGYPAIRRSELVDIEEKCRKLKAEYETKRKRPRNYTSRKEYKPQDLKRSIGASQPTIYKWLESGKLPSKRYKNKWIISQDDIRSFIQKADQHQIQVKSILLDRLRSLIK